MSLDDLSGDGQTQAGIATEGGSLWPGCVETLEYGLEIFRRHAWPVIVHVNHNLRLSSTHGNTNLALPWTERAGIVDQIADHLA